MASLAKTPENVRQEPCVYCQATPTVGFAHAGREHATGRVCAGHAAEVADAGVAVALDKGGGRNWGRR